MMTLRNLYDFEKKLAKQILYFLYTYTIYSVNTGKKTMFNLKTSNNLNLVLRSVAFKSCILKFQLQKVLLLNQAEVLNKN